MFFSPSEICMLFLPAKTKLVSVDPKKIDSLRNISSIMKRILYLQLKDKRYPD